MKLYCEQPERRIAGWNRRGFFFAVFFPSLMVMQGVIRPSEATVMSAELKEMASSDLLFWSSFGSVFIDAALSFFGPLDGIIRESTFYPPDPSELSTAELSTARSEPSSENQTLIRDAKNLLTDILLHKHVENTSQVRQVDLEEDENPAEERPEECDLRCSSLKLRGGGRGQKYEFSLFQSGDGSDKDSDGIPIRFLNMHNGNRDLAVESVKSTLKWRSEQQIDTILSRPHPKFDICAEVFPATFLGRDPDDHVIFLQRPALINLELAKKNKLKNVEILEHYIYVNEYLWQILEEDKPLGTMVSILDLSGLNMGVLRNREIVGFLKRFVSVMDSHYPQRAHKTLIVNSPKWFHTLYRIVSPLLRETTKAKIEIHSRGRKQDDSLKKCVGAKAKEKLPASFWSKKKGHGKDKDTVEDSTVPVSEMDAKMRAFVSQSGKYARSFVWRTTHSLKFTLFTGCFSSSGWRQEASCSCVMPVDQTVRARAVDISQHDWRSLWTRETLRN
jgi:hypothetical protein